MKRINFFGTVLGVLALGMVSAFSATKSMEEELVTVYKVGLKPGQTKKMQVPLKQIKDETILCFKTPEDMISWSTKQELVAVKGPAVADKILEKLRFPIRIAIGRQLIFFADFEEFGPDFYFNTESYKMAFRRKPLPSPGEPAEMKSCEDIIKEGKEIPYLLWHLMQFLSCYCNAQSTALIWKSEASQQISLLQERSAIREYFWRQIIPINEKDQKGHAQNVISFLLDGQEAENEITQKAHREKNQKELVLSFRRKILNQKKQIEIYSLLEGCDPEKEIIIKIKGSIVGELCSIFEITGDEPCLIEARQIIKDFKKHASHKKLQELIDSTEERRNKAALRSQRHLGTRAQKKTVENMEKECRQAVILKATDLKSHLRFDFTELFEIQSEIEKFYQETKTVDQQIDSVGAFMHLKDTLKKKIGQMEKALNEGQSTEEEKVDLLTGYSHFVNNLPYDQRDDLVKKIIEFFILSEDFEGALIRAEVCREEIRKKDGNDPEFLKHLIAHIKNFQGDPTELNALLEKHAREKAARAAERKAKKAQKIADIGFLAKHAQALSVEEKVPSAAAPVTEKPKKHLPPPRAAAVTVFQDHKPEDDGEAKAARHAEAVLRREREKEPPKAAEVSAVEDLEEEVSDSSEEDIRPLGDLMDFTHGTANVEAEIEGNTWRFTRKDLIQYYAQFGCCFSQAGTSHVVARLPELRESMNIVVKTKSGDLLTILMTPESFEGIKGGASTFPNWEQDFVPYYMRSQILAAREKLKAVMVVALENAPEGAKVVVVESASKKKREVPKT